MSERLLLWVVLICTGDLRQNRELGLNPCADSSCGDSVPVGGGGI